MLGAASLERILSQRALLGSFRKSGLSVYEFSKQEGFHPSQLYRMLTREKQGVEALLDQRIHNGSKSKLGQEPLVWCLAFMAQRRRASLSGAWRALESVAREQGWAYPSYHQLRLAIGKMPRDLRDLMIHGSRHQFEKWGLVRRVEYSQTNELWQVDASELPVWCLDPTSGEFFKPWVIGIIDGVSRIVLALSVYRETPNAADLLLSLRTAILPKNDDRFPFFGQPQTIQSDNGSIFASADFLDALYRLEINHQPIEKACPSQNGKIERFFRTVKDGLCANLVQFSEQYRGLATAKATPLTFPLLPGLISKFLVEYHLRRQASLGRSPWEAWVDGLSNARGLAIQVGEIYEACKIRRECKVRRDGIEMGPGIHYNAPELVPLVGQTVQVRIRPEKNDPSPTCYFHGEPIARLERVEQNEGLAESIKAARLMRLRELQRLRKTLLKTAARIMPDLPHVPAPVHPSKGSPAAWPAGMIPTLPCPEDLGACEADNTMAVSPLAEEEEQADSTGTPQANIPGDPCAESASGGMETSSTEQEETTHIPILEEDSESDE